MYEGRVAWSVTRVVVAVACCRDALLGKWRLAWYSLLKRGMMYEASDVNVVECPSWGRSRGLSRVLACTKNGNLLG
jgi:hypothetical protein